MKWLNALGLLLQFISFWLVAPEIIGKNSLIRIAGMLKKFLSNLSVIIIFLVVAAYGITFSVGGTLRGLSASDNRVSNTEFYSYLIVLGIATVLYMIFIFNYKKIRSWLDRKITGPLVDKFVQNDELRKNHCSSVLHFSQPDLLYNSYWHLFNTNIKRSKFY